MKQPSLVLHSHDVPGYKYKMWATYTLPAQTQVYATVAHILYAESCVGDQFLHNVVINCHGLPGELLIGTGINFSTLGPFAALRDKEVGRIWLVACNVHKGAALVGSKGHDFCVALAQASGCTVMAADTFQYEYEDFLPFGYIDDFEGTLYAYDGSGKRSAPYYDSRR